MRSYLAALVLLVTLPALGATVTEFNEAWRAYNAAMERKDAAAEVDTSGRVLEIGRELFEPDDQRLPVLISNHAVALDEIGREEEASALFDEALDRAEAIHGKNSIELVSLLTARANASHELGDPDEAFRHYRRALRLVAGHHGKDSMNYATLAYEAGSRLFDESRSRAGRHYMREAYEILGAAGESQRMSTGLAAYYLGRMEFSENNLRNATKFLVEAAERLDGDNPVARVYRLPVHALLVRVYELRGMSDAATPHCVAIGRDSMFAQNQDYVPLFRLVPTYPPAQHRAGKEASIDLSFTVDENGIVRDPEVIGIDGKELPPEDPRRRIAGDRDGEPRSFEESAVQAVSRFRYAPRFVDGEAVTVDGVKTRITFRIDRD